jgi:hypothetical protein
MSGEYGGSNIPLRLNRPNHLPSAGNCMLEHCPDGEPTVYVASLTVFCNFTFNFWKVLINHERRIE